MISGGVGLRRLCVLGVRAILVPVVLVTVYSRDICVVCVFSVRRVCCSSLVTFLWKYELCDAGGSTCTHC